MKKNKKGFSMVELLVVIAIIGIMLSGLNLTGFMKQSQRENFGQFSNLVYTKIEEIRNNALYGKGIKTTTGTGEKWINPDQYIVKIQSGNDKEWSIETSYSGSSDNGSDSINGIIETISGSGGALKNTFIDKIECKKLKDENNEEGINVPKIDLIFNTKNSGNISFEGCDNDIISENNKYKLLEITTKYQEFTRIISINGITGIMDKKDIKIKKTN